MGTSCETLFGKNLPENEIKQFLREIKEALSKFGKTTKFIVPKLIFRDASKIAMPEADIVPCAHKLIAEKETEYMGELNNDVIKNSIDRKEDNLLDKLVQYKHTTDDQSKYDVGQNMMFATVAGLDSTSLTISNTLLLLAMHPNVQERCYSEIMSVTSDTDTHIDADILHRLEYLNMVVKESMRIITIVPLIGRKIGCDIQTGEFLNNN